MLRSKPLCRDDKDAPVSHLVNVIISTRLNRAVVVDADQRPVGVVSDAELIVRVTPEARPGIVSSLVPRRRPAGRHGGQARPAPC